MRIRSTFLAFVSIFIAVATAGAETRASSTTLPPRGQGVFSETLFTDGTSQSQTIVHGVDGTVRVLETLRAAPEANEAPFHNEAFDVVREAQGCLSVDYDLASWKQSNTHQWWFKAGSTPSGLGASSVRSALEAGFADITEAQNNCGIPDNVSAKASYQGTTTAAINIGLTSCTTPDSKSVVGFGTLHSDTLAVACAWFSLTPNPDELITADVRFNKQYFTWFTERPVPCDEMFDIEDVMAHEVGHVFGLDHVYGDEGVHTMSGESAWDCSMSARTLAKGDILGLEARY